MRRTIGTAAGLAAAIGCAALTVTASGAPGRQTARVGQPPGTGGALTVLYSGDVDSTDPAITYYTAGFQVTMATQRTAVALTPDGRTVPDVASSMPDVSPDGLTVTLHLRAGVRFSPPVNREVTSDDVRYAIERGFFRTVSNPYVGSYFADIVGARAGVAPKTRIPGIETPDPRTVVFHLSRGTGRVLASALAMWLSAPVPRAYAARFDAHTPSDYAGNLVATGPYMIANDAQGRLVGYQPGRSIHLVRNPNWDRTTDFRPAYLNKINIRERTADTAAASRRVLAGRGLVVGDFGTPAKILRRALRRNRSQVQLVPGGGFNYMALNTKLAPLDNVDVRRAINAATDRRALRTLVGGSVAGTFAGHIIPPGVPGFEEAGGFKRSLDFVASAGPRPRLAARYLRRAGYRSGRYTGTARLRVVGSNDVVGAALARQTAAMLRRLGFTVRLRLVRVDKMLSDYCQRPQARVAVCAGGGWVKDFADAQTILDPVFNGENIRPAGNNNLAQLDDPALNRAMDAAKLVVDPVQRARAWADIDRRVMRLAPGTGWLWPKNAFVASRDVVAVPYKAAAVWDFAFMARR
jgi:peptide/nickel transport system substrate-binding protein